MKTAYKFLGKSPKGQYDFVYCTALNQSIESVQAFVESKGWSELEFQAANKPNGYEQYSFHA